MSQLSTLRIATRSSPLALWQADYVARTILNRHSGLRVQTVPFVTEGDKHIHTPLQKIGGKGLFTKTLQQALFQGAADIAVHSIKDMTVAPSGALHLVAICEREDPCDVLVLSSALLQKIAGQPLQTRGTDALPLHAVVGTASIRRTCLLRSVRPDVQTKLIRGNVQTRLHKLEAGHCDAIILAKAGLQRLGLAHRAHLSLNKTVWIPAVGQGAIGVECHRNRLRALAPILACLDHGPSRICVTAERSFNRTLGGGCHVPIAAYATCTSKKLHLSGFIAHLCQPIDFRESLSGSTEDPVALGRALAILLKQKIAGRNLGYRILD